MRESRRPPFFQSWVPDVSRDVWDFFCLVPTEDEINETYGTNKTNVTYFKETYGDIPNDLPYTLDILPHKCTYVWKAEQRNIKRFRVVFHRVCLNQVDLIPNRVLGFSRILALYWADFCLIFRRHSRLCQEKAGKKSPIENKKADESMKAQNR